MSEPGGTTTSMGTSDTGELRRPPPRTRVLMELGGIAAADVAVASAITGLAGEGLVHDVGISVGAPMIALLAAIGVAARTSRAPRALPVLATVLGVGALVVSAAIARAMIFEQPFAPRALVLAVGSILVALGPMRGVLREAAPADPVAGDPRTVAITRGLLVLGIGMHTAVLIRAPAASALPIVIAATVLALVELQIALRDRRELSRIAAWIGGLGGAGDVTLRPPPPASSAEARRAVRAVRELMTNAERLLTRDEEARVAVEQEGRVRARFMAAMGHELRSPLNSIVGFAQVLEQGTDGPMSQAQMESAVLVRRSAQELLRLLTDILDSARLEAGRIRVRRARITPAELAGEIDRVARIAVDGLDVELAVELGERMPSSLFVDRDRLVQVAVAFVRHLSRARAPARGGGPPLALDVRVRSTRRRDEDGAELRVEVRDRGRVLSDEERERMFEEFSSLRENTGRRVAGLGLAVALARRLMVLMGGEARCESEVGKGTVLIAALPLGGDDDDEAEPPSDERSVPELSAG